MTTLDASLSFFSLSSVSTQLSFSFNLHINSHSLSLSILCLIPRTTVTSLSTPKDTRCKTHHFMRQSLCSFLNARENTQIARAMTSVFLRNTRWRHSRSWCGTKYSSFGWQHYLMLALCDTQHRNVHPPSQFFVKNKSAFEGNTMCMHFCFHILRLERRASPMSRMFERSSDKLFAPWNVTTPECIWVSVIAVNYDIKCHFSLPKLAIFKAKLSR